MTFLPKILRWISLVLALILLIEGAALFIGMNLLSPGVEWTLTNNLLLIIDILVAAGLLRLLLRQTNFDRPIGLYVLLVITIITQAYRTVEYFLPVPSKFIFNETLFLVNALTLGLAITALIIGIYFQTKSNHKD
ncbi:MAG: hypothetical protein ACFE9D_03415 [Promethearchaeota archaeon]